MTAADYLQFCWQSISRYRFRSAMALIAIAFGVASVIALTALGEGARRYVLGEFAFLGKDVLVMFPGKNETTGGMPPVTGTAARDITLEDAHYLSRRISAIYELAPLVLGSAEVSYEHRAREVIVLGTTDAFVRVRQMSLAQGRNLRIKDIRRASDECLVGQKLKDELIGSAAVVGATLRVSDYRCRVVGVLAGTGDAFGMDLSDTLIISVAAAQRVFNTPGLFRVLIRLRPGYDVERTKQQVTGVMAELHQGEEDVTVVSPDAMLSTFNDVLQVMTLGVGAIGAISLLVAGILIMNITLISVSQRTEEIGLLKALGASARQVQSLFLIEAVMTSGIGAVMGLLLGGALVWLGRSLMPSVGFATPLWAVVAAFAIALLSGLLFAWLPAKRASALAPVTALQKR